ncbi:MAG: hypothetical protein AB9873_04890 [Syntrophobacteraceae bacterium]
MKTRFSFIQALLALVGLISVLLLPGCSIRYTSRDGAETYIGFLWLRQYPAGAPVVTQAKRAGVAIDVGAKQNGLLVGYEDLLSVHPPQDRYMTLDYDTSRGFTYSVQDPPESRREASEPEGESLPP